MLSAGEMLDQYLGRYVKCQDKFLLSSGQKAMVMLIADTCSKIQVVPALIVLQQSSAIVSEQQQLSVDQEVINALEPKSLYWDWEEDEHIAEFE